MKEVTIPMSLYNFLKRRQDLLESLEYHGVENWEGYQDAVNETSSDFDNQIGLDNKEE